MMTFENGITHLTQIFNDMLYAAENMFGERDKNWTFIGLEFYNDGPYIMYYPNNRVSIVLSENCSNHIPNHPQLYYQLSHEVCHILYPTGKKDANNLNEGISTYFSKIYQEKIFPGLTYAIDNIKQSNYYDAYCLVEKLLNLDGEAVKKIRAVNANISEVTKDEIASLNFGLTDLEITMLVTKF